ncbi:PIN domain-containing protein [Pyrococcus abyssi]|uniref:Nucleic acid-binding protein n=1 Tax=Pyrococcus abyssi (strain GE5 / Orsay) TaxID=272844 RepID=Q9V0L8_PYRAB|nr:PIN domain-containing protein [Pyrococcus abyssi]CAB49685.1 Hypothetical protein PAB0520 [Pyrococcus abyssi GE5]CCE70167.1 TPA: nucleic acid-binding protein [Pyrococcus abyssi GE5]
MHAVIDTDILIYDTFEDLEFHEEARALLDSLSKWYVPTIVLQEYIWFFKRNNFSLLDAKSMLMEYVRDPRFKGLGESHEVIIHALKILEENELSLSHFNDAIILYQAFSRKYPLATFDEKLRKLATKHGIRVLPEI